MHRLSRKYSIMYKVNRILHSLIPRPHHAHKGRVWGHWRRFLVLPVQQSCDYSHRFLLAHVWSSDGTQDQENAPVSPDPSPCERLGFGNVTKFSPAPFKCVCYTVAPKGNYFDSNLRPTNSIQNDFRLPNSIPIDLQNWFASTCTDFDSKVHPSNSIPNYFILPNSI